MSSCLRGLTAKWLLVLILLGGFPRAHALPSYDDVLVVINTQSAESVEIGRYFQQQRHIPERNICEISIPPRTNNSIMTVAERDAAIAAIQSHITAHGLAGQINYITLTPKIGYFAYNNMTGVSGENHIFDYYLLFMLSNPDVDIFSFNPFYHYADGNWTNLPNHVFTRRKTGFPIVTRLDGPGTVNVRRMIENTGAPAYRSYTNGIRFVTSYSNDTQVYRSSSNERGAEFISRGNIQLNEDFFENPKGTETEPILDESKVMFAYLNLVNESGIDDPPFIFWNLNFLPGSVLSIYRSFPTQKLTRNYGGVVSILQSSKARTYLRRDDGSDLAYRHLETLTVDSSRRRIWAGTGEKQQSVKTQFGLFTHQRRGNGLVVLDADTGALIAHFTDRNSGLLNNRVVKVALDPASDRLWVASYGGLQYVDLTDHSFHSIPGLTASYAAAYDVFVSPFDTNKVYASFLYENTTTRNSTLTGAKTKLFEITKSSGAVTALEMSSVSGFRPLITQTDSNTIWNVRGKTLVRMNRATQTIVNTVDLTNLVAAADYPRALLGHTNSFGEQQVFVAFPNTNNAAVPRTNYLVRVLETGPATVSATVIHQTAWNDTGTSAGVYSYYIRDLDVDPSAPDQIYMSLSIQHDGVSPLYGQILRSTDGRGATWETWIASTSGLNNLNELAFDGAGRIFGAMGYHDGQQNASDFMASGASAVAGGLSHDTMAYNRAKVLAGETNPYWINANASQRLRANHASGAYSAGNNTVPVGPMMFKMLDGYSLADSRFGTRYQYPAAGDGGHTPHMLVMEPKVAPFAPRVDETLTPFHVGVTNRIAARLFSPGLPANKDGFVAATLTADTVGLFNDRGEYLAPSGISYDTASQQVRYQRAATLTAGVYYLRLKGGKGGIKNNLGGALMNVRADEFREDTVLRFEVGGTAGNTAPVVSAGPDQVVVWPQPTVTLNGSVTDDGLPNAVSTLVWSQTAGPGTVLFGSPNAAETTATFSEPGVYILQLSAFDGNLTAYGETVVTVRSVGGGGDLLAHWSFEDAGGAPIEDASGNGRPATLNGTGSRAIGRVGKGVDLDGAGGWVNCGPAISFGQVERFTLTAWVRPEAAPTATRGRTIASALGVGMDGWAPGWNLGSDSMDDRLAFRVSDKEGHRAVASSDAFFTDRLNAWTHVAAVYEGGQFVEIYVNGVLANRTTDEIPARISFESGAAMTLGRQNGGGDAFYGQMDEVRFYGRVLGASEIAALYAEATAGNAVPSVDAGSNQSCTLPTNSVRVVGTASDDGNPPVPGALSVSWSQVSGPSTATFSSPSLLDTRVTADVAGTYQLRLTASDGEKSNSDTLTFTLQAGSISTNYARGKSTDCSHLTQSGTIQGYAYKAVDGDRTGVNSKWWATAVADNKWWEVNLGASYTMDEVRIYCQDTTGTAGTIYTFTISAYVGSSYVNVFSLTNNTQPTVVCRFPQVTASKLKLTVHAHASSGIEMYEFEAYKSGGGVTPPVETPTVTLTAPADQAIMNFGSAVTLSATAGGATAVVTKVEFFSGPDKVGEDLTSPYSLSWTPARSGMHLLSARLTDSYDRQSVSTSRTLRVNAPPQASIAWPPADSVFLVGEAIPIRAAVTDPDGSVTNVLFRQNSSDITNTIPPVIGAEWNSVGSPVASYALRIVARDQYGLAITSTPVSIRLSSTNVAPTISAQPTNTTVQAGRSATFEVQANGTALSYQWLRDGAALPGATSFVSETGATRPSDHGAAFRVVVSNAIGVVTSQVATLSVLVTAPTIVTPPADALIATGQSALFSVSASGSAPLLYQWYRNGTALPGATGVWVQTAIATEADSGSRYRVSVSNTAGSVTSPESTLTVLGSRVGFWRLDEGSGTLAQDDSGYGHDATLGATNGILPVWSLGRSAAGLTFDGTKGQYARVPGSAPLQNANGITIMAWVRDAGPSAQLVVGRRAAGGSIYRFNMNPCNLYLYTDAQGWHSGGQGRADRDWSGWHHVAWTYDAESNTTRFYVDGELDYSSSAVSTGPMNGELNSLDWGGGENGRYMDGGMDDLQLYNRALSQDEIQAASETGLAGHWTVDEESGALAYDSSGYGNTGWLSNGASRVAGKIGGAIELSRALTQNLVVSNVPVNTVTGGCNTVVFWMYWTGGNGQMPFGWNTAYDLYLTSGFFGFNTGQSNLLGIPSSGLSNRWVHVAAVFYNGVVKGNVKLFIDGVAQPLTDQLANETTASKGATSKAVFSGWGTSAGYNLDGALDDMQIYSRELSGEEIFTLWLESAEPPAISAQPQDQMVDPGQTASFSVTATGTDPLAYQWRSNGVPVSGASAAGHVTPVVTIADDATPYTVVVTNVAGAVTSSVARVYVRQNPPAFSGGAGIGPVAGGGFRFGFSTRPYRLYEVQYTDDLMSPDDWISLTNGIPGTGSDIHFEDPAPGTNRFYRLRERTP